VKYKVVYFTRTNYSKKVAEKIANKLSCEVIQITDNKNWKGFLGFMKAGFYSSINKPVEIEILGNIKAADETIVVAPLWAGGLAPAARALLKTIPLDKVHLVVTSDGSQLKNRSGYQSVSDIAKNNKNEDQVIDALVSRLKKNRT
jgi:hypothetical protein